ncbi:hypothetical protein GOV07_03845 [Candidatus Woesearchaeota archaeon]|nr:hypothetical protein [Candidatus Woesearchaeota archaeon]
MKGILMDTFKLGLGAMDLTREEASKLVKKIQKKYPGEIKDGRKMVDNLVKQGKKNAVDFSKKVEKEVKTAIKKQKLVEEADLKELAANVRELAKTTAKIGKEVGKKGVAAAKKGAKKARKAAKKKAKPKKAKRKK